MSIHVERRPAYQHSSLRRAARVRRRIFPFKATTNSRSPNQVASCCALRCVACLVCLRPHLSPHQPAQTISRAPLPRILRCLRESNVVYPSPCPFSISPSSFPHFITSSSVHRHNIDLMINPSSPHPPPRTSVYDPYPLLPTFILAASLEYWISWRKTNCMFRGKKGERDKRDKRGVRGIRGIGEGYEEDQRERGEGEW